MKKLIRTILMITIVWCCCQICWAETKYDNGTYKYEVNFYDNTCTITEYCGDDSEVTIPKSIDGCRVTKIGNSCFSGANVTKVTIPNTVTSIGNFAFEDSALREVMIPKSVTSIGECVFEGCSDLKKVVYKANTGEIPGGMFIDCVNLESISLPNGITKISHSFENCQKLKSVVIPNTVTEIEGSCFKGCTSLETFTFPPLVEVADSMVLRGCTNLTTVNFSNCSFIAGRSFADCTSLSEIIIPLSTKTVCQSAFENCTELEDVYIYNPDIELTRYAFDVTSELTLHGYKNTTTQEFAKDYEIRFKPLSYSKQPNGSIVLSKMSTPSLMTLKKGQLEVQWEKQKDVSGYQIQYSTNYDFKNSKIKKISSKYCKTTLKGLKNNKIYYVRIRSYKKVKDKTYYGMWSFKKYRHTM